METEKKQKEIIAQVKYDYSAQDSRQISLKKHEKVIVLEFNSGWCIGKNSKGKVGLFPSNYVTVISRPNGNEGNVEWKKPMEFKDVANDSKEGTDAMIEAFGFEDEDLDALLSDSDDVVSDEGEDFEEKEDELEESVGNSDNLDESVMLKVETIPLDKYNRLKEENEQLKLDLEQLRNKAQESKSINIMKRQTGVLQDQIKKLNEQNQELQSNLDYVYKNGYVPEDEQKEKVEDPKVVKLQAKVEQLMSLISDHEKTISYLKSNGSTVTSQLSLEKDTVIDKLKKERDAVVSDLEQKLEEKTSLAEKQRVLIENLEKESMKTKNSLQSLTSEQNEKESAEVISLTKEVADLKLNLEESQKKYKQQNKKFTVAIQKLGKDLDSTKKENIEKDKLLKVLKKRTEDSKQLVTYYRSMKKVVCGMKKGQEELKKEAETQLLQFSKDLSKFQKQGLKPLVKALAATTKKYKEESRQRKLLFNEIQDLKGKIRIFVRCRPLLKSDNSSGMGVKCVDELNQIKVNDHENKKTHKYEFDKVFHPKSTQFNVFEDVKGLATSILDGYNVCIFAYGQTGSGKTHTMEGIKSDPGVNSRTISELFKIQSERSQEYDYVMQISVIEIYCETIYDLLGKNRNPLKIMMAGNKTKVPDLTKVKVSSLGDVTREFDRGKKNRSSASTDMNAHSSRSHCVVSIYVEGTNKVSGVRYKGKLHLIDLAGSERVKLSNVSGQRMDEAKSINSSLSALGDVINALAAKKPHIPYRNSKLTSVLQDSLGGQSKVMMFVNVSPANEHTNETICSLKFANRVKKVELNNGKGIKKNVSKKK